MPLGDNIVDANATYETRLLLERLHAATQKGLSMIGMDSSTRFGEFMRTHPNGPKDWSKTVVGDTTDIGDVCGKAPSIYGIDIANIVGDWHGIGQSDNEKQRQQAHSRETAGNHIKTIHRNGGIITLHYHMHNPIDDSSYGKGPAEVWQLLNPYRKDRKSSQFPQTNGIAFKRFRAKIDSLVDFLQEMVDDEGKLIPVIFRPFHENNGNWFWWGLPDGADVDAYATAFRQVWQWMVWYIHDRRGHHAILWATGPNGGLGKGLLTSEDYWRTLPEPPFVDILGYDRYDDYGSENSSAVEEIRFVVQEADRLGKVAAVTESGISFKGDRSMWPENIWTKHLIGPVKNDPVATRVAWILLWHNFPNDGERGNYFGPHNNHGNAEDFRKVAQREDVLFDRQFHSLSQQMSTNNK